MPVTEKTQDRLQGYAIIRITETDGQGEVIMETWALAHEAGGHLDEFADYADAVKALNRLLSPLPGLSPHRLDRAV